MEQLTLSLEEVPVSPSQSQEDERAWAASLALCTSTSELAMKFARHGLSGKTSPEFYRLETTPSGSYCRSYRTSGMSVSPGEFWMLNSSEWHNAAAVCSLSEVLERGGAAPAVLFESESVSGNTQSSRQKRASLTRASGASSDAYCIQGGGQTSINANGLGVSTDGSAYTLTSVDRHGVVSFTQNERDEVRLQGDGTISGALSASPGMKQQTYICMGDDNGRATAYEDMAPTLKVGGRPAYVVKERAGKPGGGKGALVGEDCAFTMLAGSGQALVPDEWTVRRLTPLECERLQGFPDEWTVRRLTPLECERLQGFPDEWTAGGSDSARYKALGNSMAVPVMRWIGERIELVEGVVE